MGPLLIGSGNLRQERDEYKRLYASMGPLLIGSGNVQTIGDRVDTAVELQWGRC